MIAPNHVSYLDAPLAVSPLERKVWFIAKEELWKVPVLKWLLSVCHAFPIKPGTPDRNALRRALAELSAGHLLCIFPEGARSDDGNLLPGEAGITLLVKRSGAPVIPVAVIGTEKMLPPNAGWIHRAKLKVVYGDPIFFTPDSSREEIVGGVMQAIADLLTANGRPSTPAKRTPAPDAGYQFKA
ncbi:MAG: 1-acyl-sn-glycerol-3-phosphate acyltransferase [Armatimonadetes bacterium]|nr:1-acyl-sn-glycerol-3-phosphate acyltransferase [Armatimonadota bacterium]